MEEDDYYLDQYDYHPNEMVYLSSSSEHCRLEAPKPTPPDSFDEHLERAKDEANGQEDAIEGEFQDDYDHLYGDELKAELYLEEIWQHLGVGENGYLNLEELFRVCEHIGMSASEDMIEQLFDKLDNDRDGRLSFTELVNGLFKYVHKTNQQPLTPINDPADNNLPASSSSPPISSSSSQPTPPPPPTSSNIVHDDLDKLTLISSVAESSASASTIETNSNNIHSISSNDAGDFSHFVTIPTDKDGYTEPKKILNLWTSLGFDQVELAFKAFGFHQTRYVNVYELWAQMESRLIHTPQHGAESELYHISLATFLNEFAQLKVQYKNLSSKCDRLQANLLEANQRADYLAQEVDEQHSRMERNSLDRLALIEKKYRDEIRTLEAGAAKEKENMLLQSRHMRSEAEAQVGMLHESQNKLRLEVVALQRDNRRLEQSLARCEAQNLELKQALEEAGRLHARLVELETTERRQDNQRVAQMGEEMERWKTQAKSAQDQIDELVAEREAWRKRSDGGNRRPGSLGAMRTTPGAAASSAVNRVESDVPVGCRNKRKKRRKKKDKKKGGTKTISEVTPGASDSKLEESRIHAETLSRDDDDCMSIVSSTTTCTTITEDGPEDCAAHESGGGCKRLCQQEPIIEDIDEGEEDCEDDDDGDDDDDPSTLVSSKKTTRRPPLFSSLSEEILNYELQQQQLLDPAAEITFPMTFGTSSEQSLQMIVDRLVKECLDANEDETSALSDPNPSPKDLRSALAQIRSGTLLALRCLQSNISTDATNHENDSENSLDSIDTVVEQQQQGAPVVQVGDVFDHNNNPRAS